jgi:excisionase family DNA binding protein
MFNSISGDKVFCPLCKKYVQFVQIRRAAAIASVHRRTIYRYIEEGAVYSVRIVGKTYRICASCLLGRELVDSA